MKFSFLKNYLFTINNLLISTNTILTGNAYEVIFNDKDSKMVDKTKGVDNVFKSAVNFYGPNITSEDVVSFYESKKQPDPTKPLSFGLNSKLVKEDGEMKEVVYKADGLYGESISEIIKSIFSSSIVSISRFLVSKYAHTSNIIEFLKIDFKPI